MTEKTLKIIQDEMDQLYYRFDNLENRLFEFRSIHVIVSDDTSLHNLELRDRYQELLRILKINEGIYLDSLYNIVTNIIDLVSILDEMESSKDRYLLIKIIKSWIKEFECAYDTLNSNIQTRSINDIQVDELLVDLWKYVSKTYELLLTLY